MARTIVIAGLIVVAVGLLWPWLQRLPLGHLPGDIIIRRDGFTFYCPITTMVTVSAVVSILFWLFGR